MSHLNIPQRPTRSYLNEQFVVTDWANLKPYFDGLLERAVGSEQDLKVWLRDRSELESAISEDLGWRYIRMTCYTENKEYSDRYKDFIQNIQPQIAPASDQLNKKVAASPFLESISNCSLFPFIY